MSNRRSALWMMCGCRWVPTTRSVDPGPHDSDICCAVIDCTRDEREPCDPGGTDDMVDPHEWFAAPRRTASAFEDWHHTSAEGGRLTPVRLATSRLARSNVRTAHDTAY